MKVASGDRTPEFTEQAILLLYAGLLDHQVDGSFKVGLFFSILIYLIFEVLSNLSRTTWASLFLEMFGVHST